MSAADAVPATAANGPGATTAADRLALAGLLAIALAVRLAFYTGFFGSDEVTYVANAYRLLDGDWQVSSYVGSNRYGMNLPLAAMAFLFGRHEMVANAYPLLCSLGEVALVFHFGRQLLGLRAAVLGALLLALLPLHAHYAGRLMADAPLALMITASFLFFWHGERNGDRCSFVIAGLAAGCSFWIKPHAIIYLAVFAAYPLLARRWDRRWLLMAGACGLMIAANCLLFRFLSGDFFFLVEAMRSRHTGVDRAAAAAADPFHVSAGYYLVYLLARVYHTWIVFHLALAALFLWWLRRRRGATADDDAMRFLLWWAAGLLLVFSLFVASWNPFVLIPKQTNYMLMFVAPLALLAGHALAHARGVPFLILLLLVAGPALLLTAMQQSLIHVFTANSKATVEFARAHADAEVYGNTNAVRAAQFARLVQPHAALAEIRPIADLLAGADDGRGASPPPPAAPRYAVIDSETVSWGRDEPLRDISQVPPCWIGEGVLQPSAYGLGPLLLRQFAAFAALLPETLAMRARPALASLTQPRPAYVYRIPAQGCG